jgi:RNA polymerase sigma-70 factor (ECF subfamily)
MLHPDASPPADWDRLVALVRNGSESAARSLVEALYPHVIRIVRSHLPRATDEQDVAQDVFLKVFTRINSFRADQPFHHWVARITVNTCVDRLRRQKIRPEIRFADLTEDEAAFLENSVANPELSSDPAASDGREVVDKLLDTLNPTEQTVLRLLDLEQKSVREISDLTGWGLSKVKVTAMRARRKLNETLQRLESGLKS